MNNSHECVECGIAIPEKAYLASDKKFGSPLCQKHQRWLVKSKATPEAITLYVALKTYKVPVLLEYWDGKKSIDIAVPGKLYIEVEKLQEEEADVALIRFLQTFQVPKETIPTITISPSLMSHRYEFNIAITRLIELWLDCKQTG
jgi:hypothetical protein